jgi:hypothetical protein
MAEALLVGFALSTLFFNLKKMDAFAPHVEASGYRPTKGRIA